MNKAVFAEKVLLVEDSKLVQKIEKILLEQLGYEVDAVYSGEEAIEAVSSHSYQFIFIDIGLPGIDGIEATQKIRECGYEGVIVALTAHENQVLVEQALGAGMNAYLKKPLIASDAKKIIAGIR